MNNYLLGVDTSNYRTSLCIIDRNGSICAEQKELLTVSQGERGLRQSEAVFQHIKKLPELARKLTFPAGQLIGVAVSTRPRPVEGSYMPVFKVGESWAAGIATMLKIPLFETSHQEMHVAAGEFSSPFRPENDEFLAVHLSGGTSELLQCTRTEEGYDIVRLGGTSDLHAGQLVDRIGVALGLPFPAGVHLEELAKLAGNDGLRVPSAVKGCDFHLSGAETQLLKYIQRGEYLRASIARAVEHVIASSLEKIIRNAISLGKPKEVLIVGGVAANEFIRERLRFRLEHPAVGGKLYFAAQAYSGDNAFGVAIIGLKKWIKTNE